MYLYYYAKFAILYHMEHYHCLQMNKISRLLAERYSQSTNEEFLMFTKRFLYHMRKFDNLCRKLDELRAIMIKKYPFLAD